MSVNLRWDSSHLAGGLAAPTNLKHLCEAHLCEGRLAGKYRIEIIDLPKRPERGGS